MGVSLAHLTPIIRHRSAHNRIALFQHPHLGKVFVLNGEIQHVEAWAPLYHEPLVHLAGAFVPSIKSVLILGGGTMYAAYEVLKYKSIENVVLVDHDPRVTETVIEYYSHARVCRKDRRLNVVEDDAYTALSYMRNQFDLVINDGADLLNVTVNEQQTRPKAHIFSRMARLLNPKGVCVDVVQRHMFDRLGILRTLRCIRRNFRMALSLVFLPEYHGILHVLTIWGGRFSNVMQSAKYPQNSEQLAWLQKRRSCPCVYYDPRFLAYYLYLPRYLTHALRIKGKVS